MTKLKSEQYFATTFRLMTKTTKKTFVDYRSTILIHFTMLASLCIMSMHTKCITKSRPLDFLFHSNKQFAKCYSVDEMRFATLAYLQI